jgi:multidrug resistance efflux pump
MSFSFRRTRSVFRDDGTAFSTAFLLSGLLLVAAWVGWAFRAHVARYEVSDSARLEVTAAGYPLQATVSGRLVADKLTLGREVEAGEVLAEVDNRAEQLALEEERTRAAAFAPQIAALKAQMAAETTGHNDEQHVLSFSVEAATATLHEAEAQAALAATEAERAQQLRKEGIIAEADLQRALADAHAKRAAEENLRAALMRLRPEQAVRDSDRDLKLRELAGEIAKLNADWSASLASIQRLDYELERHRIRAPITGRLGECAVLHRGSHISEGQQLGVIVPPGKLQITAQFQPPAALGKVRPGQSAMLKLDGFPWAQFGTVPARVTRVADEIRDGKVRVELAVNGPAPSRIPLQHGLPGSVEIEVERISPAAMILRSAGEIVGAH